ncbi:MAG: hypothetical protein ABR552_06580 [Actinomycetota bacterium]
MRRKLIVPFLMGVAVLVIVQAAVADPGPPSAPVDPNWFTKDLPIGHRSTVGPTGITVNPMGCPSDCITLPPPPNPWNIPNGSGTPLEQFGDTGRIRLPGGISIQPNQGATGVILPPPPDPNWLGSYAPSQLRTTRVSGGGLTLDPRSSPTGIISGVNVDPNWFVPSQCSLQGTKCR